MKAPKEFIQKIEKLKALEKESEALRKEITDWITENGGHDCFITDIDLCDEPQGEWRDDGEWCNQWTGYLGDDFSGTYYHQIEDSDLYLAYSYEC